MAVVRNSPAHSTDSTNIADLLERVLDKGVVIAGDIKVSLLDIELLTIQIRLVICSIDKAQEMGMDWWANSPVFGNDEKKSNETIDAMQQKLDMLEAKLQQQENDAKFAEPKRSAELVTQSHPGLSDPPRFRPVDPEASA